MLRLSQMERSECTQEYDGFVMSTLERVKVQIETALVCAVEMGCKI